MLGEEILDSLQYAIAQFTIIEAMAVFFGILYIMLAAKENIWCWAAAIISVLLYIYICIKAQLYAETGLQIFYLVMAVYGYYQWKSGGNEKKDALPISAWPIKNHVTIIISGVLIVIGLGYFLQNYTQAQLPYLDSFTTVFSMITTYMVTRKKIENWLYWLIIDGAAVYLYIQRDLFLTALLFFGYTIIVIFGYFQWLKIYRQQT